MIPSKWIWASMGTYLVMTSIHSGTWRNTPGLRSLGICAGTTRLFCALRHLRKFRSLSGGGESLVEMFLDDGCFSTKDIESLQCYRRFRKKPSVSDLLLCDGLTIDPTVMNSKEGYSKRRVLVERLTRNAHKLWCYAIKCITSPNLKLCQPLGPLLVDPPSHRPWFSSDDKSLLSLQLDDDSWAIYEPIRTTRSLQYEWSYSVTDCPRHTLLASVDMIESRQRRREPTPIAP